MGVQEVGKTLSLSLSFTSWSELTHPSEPFQGLRAGFTRERRLQWEALPSEVGAGQLLAQGGAWCTWPGHHTLQCLWAELVCCSSSYP